MHRSGYCQPRTRTLFLKLLLPQIFKSVRIRGVCTNCERHRLRHTLPGQVCTKEAGRGDYTVVRIVEQHLLASFP